MAATNKIIVIRYTPFRITRKVLRSINKPAKFMKFF
jgi:hypothetical protein